MGFVMCGRLLVLSGAEVRRSLSLTTNVTPARMTQSGGNAHEWARRWSDFALRKTPFLFVKISVHSSIRGSFFWPPSAAFS